MPHGKTSESDLDVQDDEAEISAAGGSTPVEGDETGPDYAVPSYTNTNDFSEEHDGYAAASAPEAGKLLARGSHTVSYGNSSSTTSGEVYSKGALTLDSGGTFRNSIDITGTDSGSSVGHSWTTTKYGVYERITGSSGDDVIYGGDSVGLPNNVTYFHDDDLYGGAGNDRLFGLAGDDTINGGTGNDILDGGSGSDVLNGGAGNDWLFTGRQDGSGQEQLTGGTGADVFVIGDASGFNADEATPQWSDINADLFWSVGSAIPKAGGLVKAAKMWVDWVSEATAGENINYATDEMTAPVVTDFDPTEDVFVVPLKGSGSANARLVFDGLPAGEAFRVVDDATGGDVIAVVKWGDLSAKLGVPVEELSAPEKASLQQLIENSILIMSAEGVATGSGTDLDMSGYDLSQLGSGSFMIFGAHSGQVFRGSSSEDYGYGTEHNDVIMGYNYGGTGDADTAGNDYLYGFGGDDLFITGAGINRVYGGEGEDTVAYYDVVSGVTVDLGNKTDGTHVEVHAQYDSSKEGHDRLYSVENVIGSRFNDVLKGDSGANVLESGQGNDTLTGGGGTDTFVFSGGVNTVSDYESSDRVVVDMAAYGIQNEGSVSQRNTDDGFELSYGNTVIAKLEGASSEVPIGYRDDHGNIRWYHSHRDDRIDLEDGDIYVRGLSGNDTITGNERGNHLYGDSGNDVIYGGGGNDYISGDHGDDTIDGGAGNDFIRGGAGDDSIRGGDGDDILYSGGAAGNGPWGGDRLYGEDGDDALFHDGPNHAHLFGGNGDDWHFQFDGFSHMFGGAGNDFFVVSNGKTEVEGGSGVDTFVLDGGTMNIKDYEHGETVFIDYDSYGYSSASAMEKDLSWSKNGNAGTVTQISTGKTLMTIEGDLTYSVGFKIATDDWTDGWI